jgi:hypothetical protein
VIFEPLPAGSSLTVVAMASRQLGAYYEDELGPAKGLARQRMASRSIRISSRSSGRKSSREFEDMGEFIRESIDEWLRHKKEATKTQKRQKHIKTFVLVRGVVDANVVWEC